MGEGSDPASRAERLRQARADANLKREDVAAKLGVSPESVKNWENPKTTAFPFKHLRDIARLYEVDEWWLVDGRPGYPLEGSPAAPDVIDELREIRRLLADLLRKQR